MLMKLESFTGKASLPSVRRTPSQTDPFHLMELAPSPLSQLSSVVAPTNPNNGLE